MSEHDLTAALAVDALEADEARAAEAHLAGCSACRQELAQLREALADAVVPVPEDQVPTALRGRVMDALDDVPQLPPLAVVAGQPPSAPGAARDDLQARRARRAGSGPRRWAQGLAAAAAAVVVAVAAVSGYAALQWRGEAAQARQAAVALAEVAAAPDAVTVAAQGTDQAWSGTRVLVSQSLGEAVMVPSGVGEAPDGSTWQLWFIDGGQARAAGVFSTADGSPAVLHGDVDGASAVAVTLEPAGGSDAPTSTPVAVYPLQA